MFEDGLYSFMGCEPCLRPALTAASVPGAHSPCIRLAILSRNCNSSQGIEFVEQDVNCETSESGNDLDTLQIFFASEHKFLSCCRVLLLCSPRPAEDGSRAPGIQAIGKKMPLYLHADFTCKVSRNFETKFQLHEKMLLYVN